MRLSGKSRYGIFCSQLLFFRDGLINQKDRNLIPNGIHAPACRTLQALAVVLRGKRLPAHGTHQNFKQVLGKHDVFILLSCAWSSGGFVRDDVPEWKSTNNFPIAKLQRVNALR
jgi:hypothetical protein